MDNNIKPIKFTIDDIVSKNEKRNNSKDIIKNIFIERCKKRIESYNKFRKDDVLFEVIDFMIGVPPYDPKEITTYLLNYLSEAGFYVFKLPKVNVIYISWKKDDIQKLTNQKNGYLSVSLNNTGFFDNLPINPKALNK